MAVFEAPKPQTNFSSLQRVLEDFATDVVQEELRRRTSDLKANLRINNLAEHMRKVQELSDAQQVQQCPPTVETVELTEEWFEHVQDIDPDDEVFATMWQKWMTEMANSPYTIEHKYLLEVLKHMDGFDANLLIQVNACETKSEYYRGKDIIEYDRLKKLEKRLLLSAEGAALHPRDVTFRISSLGKKLISYYNPFTE